jgi:hypothetical protein
MQTARADYDRTETDLIAFAVDRPVTVYVAYDERGASTPGWMAGWEDTGMLLLQQFGSHRLWRQSFPAGQVVLGGNDGATTGALMTYVAIITEQSYPPPAIIGPIGTPLGPWNDPNDSDGDGLPNDFETPRGLNPNNPDTDGDGDPDEIEPSPAGGTYWEEYLAGPPPAPAPGRSSGGGGGGCGSVGLDLLWLPALLLLRRRRRKRYGSSSTSQ